MKAIILLLFISQITFAQSLEVDGSSAIKVSTSSSEHQIIDWAGPVHVSKLYSSYPWLPNALEKQQQRGDLKKVILFEGVTYSKRDAIHFSFSDPYNDQILMDYTQSGRVICGNGYCNFYLLRWPGGTEYSIDTTLQQFDPVELHYNIIAKSLTEAQMMTVIELAMNLNYGFIVDQTVQLIEKNPGIAALYDPYPWLEAHVYKWATQRKLNIQSIAVYPDVFIDWSDGGKRTGDALLYSFQDESKNMLIKEVIIKPDGTKGGLFASQSQKNIDKYYSDRLSNPTIYSVTEKDQTQTIIKYKVHVFNVPKSKYIGHFEIEFEAGDMNDIEIEVIDPKTN